MEVSGQLHALTALPSGKYLPGTHWIGDSVGPSLLESYDDCDDDTNNRNNNNNNNNGNKSNNS
jgi:hypothetical protein